MKNKLLALVLTGVLCINVAAMVSCNLKPAPKDPTNTSDVVEVVPTDTTAPTETTTEPEETTTETENASGITFKTLTVNERKVFGTVSNKIDTFSFLSEITTTGTARYSVALDVNGTQPVFSKKVTLSEGDNTFYIFVEIENNLDIYTVTITREVLDFSKPKDQLPSDLTFSGAEVRVLGWNNQEHQTFPKEGLSYAPIKRKLYNHWLSIEERFNITFKVDYTDSEWSSNPQFLIDARADSAQYDLMQTQTLYPVTLAMEGRLVNLMPLEFPDLEMPWWSDSISEWSQHSALFFISSNSSIMTINNMNVMFVNSDMIASKGHADPIQSVLRGTWTVDEVTKISKSFAGEAANATEDSRIYGVVADDHSRLDSFYYAMGFSSVKNVNGVGTLGYDEESELQSISSAIDTLEPLFAGYGTELKVSMADNTTELYQRRAAIFLGYMEYVRSTGSYSVIPFPMLNEAQYDTMGYRTIMRDYADVWCIPVTTQNKVLSGMILEANASDEYSTVAPFYYEQYLKDRYANASQGIKCFEILRSSLVYDFGRVCQVKGIGAEGLFRACLNHGFYNTFAREARRTTAVNATRLNEILDAYQRYKNN